MIRRPLLVQEKVDFYVWRSRIRKVVDQYCSKIYDSIPNFGCLYVEQMNGVAERYNWRHLTTYNNVIRNLSIWTKTGYIDLPKYYFFSNGIQRIPYGTHHTYGYNH